MLKIFWDTEIKNIDYKKLKKIGFITIKCIAKTKLVYLSKKFDRRFLFDFSKKVIQFENFHRSKIRFHSTTMTK